MGLGRLSEYCEPVVTDLRRQEKCQPRDNGWIEGHKVRRNNVAWEKKLGTEGTVCSKAGSLGGFIPLLHSNIGCLQENSNGQNLTETLREHS